MVSLTTFLDALGLCLVMTAAVAAGAFFGGALGVVIASALAAVACFASSYVIDSARRRR